MPADTANGLKNSLKAEIHLVVRTHGVTDDTGEAVNQLTTFEDHALCTDQGRVCANVQAVIFEAVE